MAEKITDWLNQFPIWAPLAILALLFLGLGFFLARKLWGKNVARLKSAIDDSAYLASQWATLGISQSQLVERLDKRTHLERKDFWSKAKAWQDALAERDRAIDRLQKEIARYEESKSSLSEREVDALQLQVSEIQKRDARIQTLEDRLQFLDSQSQQSKTDHQKQTKVLLDRISVLESSGYSSSDPEIEENNRQLTELLKERCNELGALRDEFCAKEKDLATLREQNTILKSSVDDLVSSWSDKKDASGEMSRLKEGLDSSSEELDELRKEYDKKVEELECLVAESGDPEGRDKKLAAELVEARAEISRTSDQVNTLLDVIEARDSKVEELENMLDSKSSSRQHQVEALSQTIADLQSKANQTESGLAKAEQEIDDLQAELDSVILCHHHELEIRERQISLLKENLEPDLLDSLDLDAVCKPLEDIDPEKMVLANRILSETKNYGSRRRKDSPPQRGMKSVIYFGENSAFIKGESFDVISSIARDVLDSGCQISLVGFAENEGNDEFNETMSMRRAEAVREKFEEEGVDSSHVIVKGKGEDTEFSESGESWKARRVEIVVLPVAEIIN